MKNNGTKKLTKFPADLFVRLEAAAVFRRVFGFVVAVVFLAVVRLRVAINFYSLIFPKFHPKVL
jgi:hypothetical protein